MLARNEQSDQEHPGTALAPFIVDNDTIGGHATKEAWQVAESESSQPLASALEGLRRGAAA